MGYGLRASVIAFTAFLALGCSNAGRTTGTYSQKATNGDNSSLSTSALKLVSSADSVSVGGTLSLRASGGVPPYQYSVLSGSGSVGSQTGVYTAPALPEIAYVEVDDAVGHSAFKLLTVQGQVLTGLAISNATFVGVGFEGREHIQLAGHGFGASGAVATLSCDGSPVIVLVDSQSDTDMVISFAPFASGAHCEVAVAAAGNSSNVIQITI